MICTPDLAIICQLQGGFCDHPDPSITTNSCIKNLFVLGWGSNLLALDGDLDIAVVSLGQAGNPLRCGQSTDGRELVLVPGGCMLPKLLNWAAREGLSGLEGLSGIPGTVGGAVAMNAGSYGRETAELLDAVRVWDMSGGLRWIGPEQWLAGYRRFTPLGLDEPWLVLEARYALAPAAPEAVRAAMDDVLARKKATQPVSAATCGCVFKNPKGASAGKMLDELGFKGKALGGMRFSNMHANFLVNDGRGTAMAALELIDQASQAVLERFGVELELEVKVVQ